MLKIRPMRMLRAFAAIVLLGSTGLMAGENSPVTHFGNGKQVNLNELPECILTQQLRKLSADNQKKALNKLSRMNFSNHTIQDLRADSNGGIYCSCDLKTTKGKAKTP